MTSASLHAACAACTQPSPGELPFSMAFQPIVDVRRREVFAYEALVRGPEGQGAPWVLGQVTPEGRYRFDQACRLRALRLAAGLGLGTRLSINFMPEAVYEPRACIRLTLATAREVGISAQQLIFEVVESERPSDPAHLQRILTEYRRLGFATALDDFGSGHATPELARLLAPDFLKLDRGRTRELDRDPAQAREVAASVRFAQDLGVTVIGEGVETPGEARALRDLGVTLMQGYHFARPPSRRCRTYRPPPTTSERRERVPLRETPGTPLARSRRALGSSPRRARTAARPPGGSRPARRRTPTASRRSTLGPVRFL